MFTKLTLVLKLCVLPSPRKKDLLLVGRFCINGESPQDLVLVNGRSISSVLCNERASICVRVWGAEHR